MKWKGLIVSKLEEYIETNFVATNYGDYAGIKSPSLEQLLILQQLIQIEITNKISMLGIKP